MSALQTILEAGLKAEGGARPRFPGAVAILLRDGQVVEQVTVGNAAMYAATNGQPVPRPESEREPMRPDTIFDIASLSKLFTAVTTMKLVEDGHLTLDDSLLELIPEWAEGDRSQITLRHLLTHVSGLPGVKRLWEIPEAERVDAVFGTDITREPGSHFEYSCVGYIVVGLMLERLTGMRLDRLVTEIVLDPLQLTDTTYNPPTAVHSRIAPTEYQPYVDRGMVRGSVHDETNWSLGGTAGNAGLFSTAHDLGRFGEMLRRGGELDGIRILDAGTVREMTTNQLPPTVENEYGQGIGPRINDRSFMGALADHDSFGHTGFTGTAIVVTPSLDATTILLTNRVHPSREWSDISEVRRTVAGLVTEVATT